MYQMKKIILKLRHYGAVQKSIIIYFIIINMKHISKRCSSKLEL